ncbi:hypothetical protein ACP4OV_011885 [Aristida adscensionis]
MVAILRSSVAKTIRRAFLSEGTLPTHLPKPRWCLLHTGRAPDSTYQADVCHGKPSPELDKVNLLVKKVEDVSKKAMLVEYTQSLVKEQKAKVESAHLLGIALPGLLGVCFIGLFAAGYLTGFYEAVPGKDQRSEVKELEA